MDKEHCRNSKRNKVFLVRESLEKADGIQADFQPL